MRSTITLITFLLGVTLYSQSPWTQKKGKAYTQLSLSSIGNYDELFGNPDIFTERFITDQTLQFYGEYGLSNKTSLLLSIPLKITETGMETVSNGLLTNSALESSLGNITFGLKHNFLYKKWLLTGQFTIESNTGTYFEDSGIRTGFNAWSFNPMISTGKSFKNVYLQAFLGAEFRTNDYSSNLRFGGEIGYKIFKPLWLVWFLDVSNSFKDGDVVLPIENQLTGLYINNIEFAAYGLKAIGEIFKNFGVTASLASAFSGNNVPKNSAITFGLYQKF